MGPRKPMRTSVMSFGSGMSRAGAGVNIGMDVVEVVRRCEFRVRAQVLRLARIGRNGAIPRRTRRMRSALAHVCAVASVCAVVRPAKIRAPQTATETRRNQQTSGAHDGYSFAACGLVGAEHGDRFDLDQQLRPAEMRLNAGGGGQRIEPLLLEKRGALLVEGLVVALDVAQVAGGAHNVVPGAAFALEQAGDVVEGAPHLARESRRCVRSSPCSSIDAVPEISRIVSPFRSIRMPRENELGLA